MRDYLRDLNENLTPTLSEWLRVINFVENAISETTAIFCHNPQFHSNIHL